MANNSGRQALAQEQSSGALFSVALEDYIKRDAAQRNKASSLYQLTKAIELDVLPVWRGKRVDEITKRDVNALLDSIIDRGAPIKARRVCAYLARIFRWCVDREVIRTIRWRAWSAPALRQVVIVC